MLLLLFVSLCVSRDALVLTNYLNDPATGRSLARVFLPPPFSSLESYSGLFEISPQRYTFFWWFPNANQNAPTVTWNQGGPGASSMFGLFSEHGPFSVSVNGTLVPRETAWTKPFSMLYIDNPVGVGFSRTDRPDGFVQNEDEVGRDQFSFISQFFQIFPDRAANPLYIAGESYGGKYAPSFAFELSKQIAAGNSTLNLQGVMVGDGAIDPATQFVGYSQLAFYMGFANLHERDVMAGYEAVISSYIQQQNWKRAFEVFDELLNGDFFPFPTYFRNITGLSDYFNMLSPTYAPNPYPNWLQANVNVLHVGDGAVYWDYNATVEKNLINDWMQGVVPKLESLLSHTSVLIYNGQLDVILGPPLCLNALAKLNWAGASSFAAARKQIWKLPYAPNEVAGYIIESQNGNRTVGLTHATVRLAGHLVPEDAPAFAYDLVQRFVGRKGWN